MQFVEIKGSVFKKFEKNNLFQMSNSGMYGCAHPGKCEIRGWFYFFNSSMKTALPWWMRAFWLEFFIAHIGSIGQKCDSVSKNAIFP